MVERAGKAVGLGPQGPRTYAAPYLRLRACERRPRHPITASVPRLPDYPEHSAVFRARANAVREVVAGLSAKALVARMVQGFPALSDQVCTDLVPKRPNRSLRSQLPKLQRGLAAHPQAPLVAQP